MGKAKALLERLRAGEYVICAEGYLFALESRGFLKAGAYVPEVVLDKPEVVRELHEEFVLCGSDVVEAFTYYAHREKLRLVGREDDLERMNRAALRIAREVADATGTLMAGNICNTNIYQPNNPESEATCRAIFEEQVRWAVEEGADYVIAETFGDVGEAILALQTIKNIDSNMPAVITIYASSRDKTYDGYSYPDALRKLEELGADVVGLNCHRGPETILPLMVEIRKVGKSPLACLPVAYRTSEADGLSMQSLKDKYTGQRSFPADLDAWLVSCSCIANMTKELMKLNVQYMGVCCGNRPAYYIRTMAETLGHNPPASKYSSDMTQHISQGSGGANSYVNQNWNQSYDLKLNDWLKRIYI